MGEALTELTGVGDCGGCGDNPGERRGGRGKEGDGWGDEKRHGGEVWLLGLDGKPDKGMFG
jgi:hypothetical protein